MDQHLEFRKITLGQELPERTVGPLSPVHLFRWSATIENWHRIHYDAPFATEHDELPGLLVQGSWKQHILVHVVEDWAAPTGWLWHVRLRFTGMDVVWDHVTAGGTVVAKREEAGLGLVTCQLGLRNQRGVQSAEGLATVAFPLAADHDVPYPFTRDYPW